MHPNLIPSTVVRAAVAAALALVAGVPAARATEPCGGFGECKALIEINATDGDIGFHFLMDGENLSSATLSDGNGALLFEGFARGPLLEQRLTEIFAESAEPLCWHDPEAEPGELVVTLEEFLARIAGGTYRAVGTGGAGAQATGEDVLTRYLPAAPADVEYEHGEISWHPGDDLGRCASFGELAALVGAGVLPQHPADVAVAMWEVVLEPVVPEGDPTGQLKFTVRVPSGVSALEVAVPRQFLAAFGPDTPGKVEVGAIGLDDNATFSEEEVCINERRGCEEDEE